MRAQSVQNARTDPSQSKPQKRAAFLLAILLLLLPLPTAAQQSDPTPAGAETAATISALLSAEFARDQGPHSFLVILDEQVDVQAVAAGVTSLQGADAGDGAASALATRTALYHALVDTAQRSQAPLRAWLEGEDTPYRSFYIVNMIEVMGDATVAGEIAGRSEVARLAANLPAPSVQGPAPASVSPHLPVGWVRAAGAPDQSSVDLPWGLTASGAPEVWALGYTGEGVVIASQDTGVEWDHPALQESYRGWEVGTASHVYNWFDAFGQDGFGPCGPDRDSPQVPCDDYGHGTHTVGTMTGDASSASGPVLGMAPGAEWIGCRNMLAGNGTPASYTACFEFFLAPFPQAGDPQQDGRPELAPDIINNSWGCPPSEGCNDPDTLRQVVETARAAGQYVVASAGNKGPECGTVVDPIALYDASFTVGGYAEGGAVFYQSSRGPVTIDGSQRLKPDISAPAVLVYSAGPGDGYYSSSGTSMAAPHAAGAVALLWSASPALKGNIPLSEHILLHSATSVANGECPPGQSPTVPNATFGHGRLNALAAVELALNPPTVRVLATHADGRPLSGYARVRLTEPWSEAPRWVTPNAAGEIEVPVYTLEWSGVRTAPLELSWGGNSSAQITDGYGRLLLQAELFDAAAIFPIVRR